MYQRVHPTYSETTKTQENGAKMKPLLIVLLLTAAMQAQNLAITKFALPDEPKQQHTFWTLENKVGASLLAGLVAADAITTQRGLSQGLRETNPVMRPFVTRGSAGEAAGSALGFGAAVGTVYLLHRTHHYKSERIAMRMMVAGETGFVANNIIAIR
jgi:hypothetical protein